MLGDRRLLMVDMDNVGGGGSDIMDIGYMMI